jgi:hypothetical protein
VGLSIFILCLFDGGFTIYSIEHGIAEEANPLVSWCMETLGFGGFLFIKVFLASLVLFLTVGFWNQFRVARIGGVFVVAVYLALVIYHVFGIYILGD